MNNKAYILMLLAAMSGAAYGSTRSLEEARILAQDHLSQQLGHAAIAVDAALTPMHAQGNHLPFIPFYAFNDASGKAFVLISGSTLMPELLGYSDEGAFPSSIDQMPDNMQGWLQYVAEVEQYLEDHPESAALMERRPASTQPISQLVTSEWGQDAPYNDLCPMKGNHQTVTGCMATSISQVLNYHQYPTQLEGTYTYYDGTTKRTTDFSEVSIDYSLLRDKYARNAGTEEERAEVAKLMLNVGLALSMQYGTNAEGGSGAVSGMGDRGLHENLGCTKSQTLNREFYSLTDWNTVLQDELRSGRPVVFGGQSSEGGHSFILDGLDSHGFYHVNWGWDGAYQGYFDVSVLHPESVGTGATASVDGFVGSQHAIVNLCAPEKAGRWHSQLEVHSGGISTSTTNTAVGGSVTFKASVLNNSYDPFKGKVGVVLMKDGEVIDRKMSSSTISIDATRLITKSNGGYSYSSYGDKNLSFSYSIPTDLSDGVYKAYMCVQPNDCDDYDIVHCSHTRHSYRSLTVTDGKVTISGDNVNMLVEVTGWNFDEKQMRTAPETLTAYLENTSDEAVSYTFYLKLTNPSGKRQNEITSPVITLEPGETGEVSFNYTFNAVGEWTAQLQGSDLCVSDKRLNFDSREFDVILDPTQGASFSLTKKVDTVDEKVYNIGEASFCFTVENKGTDYDGEMSVRLYSSKSSTASKNLLGEVLNDNVQVGGNETKEIVVTGELNIDKLSTEKATVYARVFYLKGDEMEQIGTGATTVTIWRKDQDEAISNIQMDEPASQRIRYDLTGRRVGGNSHMTHSIQIVNGEKQLIR